MYGKCMDLTPSFLLYHSFLSKSKIILLAKNVKIVYNNKIYECTTANSDATFDASNWDIPVDVTTLLYRCVTANNDANFTPSKWEVVGHLYATDADIDSLFI